MWLRLLILFLLFGFLGILQTSFLAHFNIMGSAPNLVFILFFLAVFFSARSGPALGWEDILYSVIAGFFLDILFFPYFGGAIVLLLIIVFILKHLLFSLKKTRDKYPIVYFAPLFVLSLIVFNLPQAMPRLSWAFLIEIVYNLVFALFGFYIYPVRNPWFKKILKHKNRF